MPTAHRVVGEGAVGDYANASTCVALQSRRCPDRPYQFTRAITQRYNSTYLCHQGRIPSGCMAFSGEIIVHNQQQQAKDRTAVFCLHTNTRTTKKKGGHASQTYHNHKILPSNKQRKDPSNLVKDKATYTNAIICTQLHCSVPLTIA